MSRSQGHQANHSGKAIEDALLNFLRGAGYQVERQVQVGIGIYGQTCTADLVLPGVPLILEVKWQDRRGSTDEKFPFLLANIRSCYPYPTVVMVDGGGARAGSVDWLKRQVDGAHLLKVFTLAEFYSHFLRETVSEARSAAKARSEQLSLLREFQYGQS